MTTSTANWGLTDKVINVPTPQGTIEGRLYQGQTLPLALSGAYKQGYRALNAPEVAGAVLIATKGDPVLDGGFVTTTLEATGRTRQGRLVYVIAHGNHPFTSPDKIEQVRRIEALQSSGSSRPGGKLANEEFWTLLDREDGKPSSEEKEVYVLSEEQMRKEEGLVIEKGRVYERILNYEGGILGKYSLENAAMSPVFTAFLAGEERKLQWLQRIKGLGEGFAYAWQAFLVDEKEGVNVGRLVDISQHTLLGWQQLTWDDYGYARLVVVHGVAPSISLSSGPTPRESHLERLLTPVRRIFTRH